jgi:hypothetical protein
VDRTLGGRLLAPLLLSKLGADTTGVDPRLLTYLRTATVREELRSREVTRILTRTVETFESAGLEAIALRGTALPYLVYPAPALRHTHDLDFLVRHRDVHEAAARAMQAGFSEESAGQGVQGTVFRGLHVSGLPISLHMSLFRVQLYDVPTAEIWANLDEFRIGEFRARTLAGTEQLFHVCVHAATSGHRNKLLWATDAWLTINSEEDLDWSRLVSLADSSRAALPLGTTLSYLRRRLDAPVPEPVLGELSQLAARSDRLQREIALFGAWEKPGSKLATAINMAGRSRERLFLLRWRLLPSPKALAQAGRTRSVEAWPKWYAGRPIRFLRTLLQRLRQAAGGAATSGAEVPE